VGPTAVSPGRYPLGITGSRSALFVEGELDAFTAPTLQSVIGDLIRGYARTRMVGAQIITLDLSGVTFIDCAGLRTVLSLRDLCHRRQIGFRIVSPSRVVRRLVELAEEPGLLADSSPGVRDRVLRPRR
jgi:anti-anti-sigma factor